MTFRDSPSQFASMAKWEAWAERLKTFNPHDKTVIAEKIRISQIIQQRRQPKSKVYSPIPD